MNKQYDVAIIGSGVMGCLAYDFFARENLDVVMISEDSLDGPQNFSVIANKSTYSGVTHGRHRGLGGTSVLWGGAMNSDIRSHPVFQKLAMHSISMDYELNQVFKFFGIRRPKVAKKSCVAENDKYRILEEDIIWPNFWRRNAYKNLSKIYKNEMNIKIGVLKKVQKERGLSKVSYLTTEKKVKTIYAKKVFLGLGFIENIKFAQKYNNNAHSFYEHISAPVLKVKRCCDTCFSPSLKFKGTYFKTKRYDIYDKNLGRSVGFFHLHSEKSRFLMKLRVLLLKIQQNKLPTSHEILALLSGVPDLLTMLYTFVFKSGELSYQKSNFVVHLVRDQKHSIDIAVTDDVVESTFKNKDIEYTDFMTLRDDITSLILDNITVRPDGSAQLVKLSDRSLDVIYHPFGAKLEGNGSFEFIGTHQLSYLGALSPTIPAYLFNIPDFKNATNDLRTNSNEK